MTGTPQHNCTLLGVYLSGGTDEWTADPMAGAPKWEGELRAYLRERRREVNGDGGRNVLVDRLLIVPVTLGVDWREDDRVRVKPDGRPEIAASVIAVDHRQAQGIPKIIQTTRVTLEEA